jgi:hypothetical protein
VPANKVCRSEIRLSIYDFSVYAITKKMGSLLVTLSDQDSESSEEDEGPDRDLIGTCFILVLFKFLMELRDRHYFIGLLECGSVAELNTLRHLARSRPRPKWLVDSHQKDIRVKSSKTSNDLRGPASRYKD